MNFTLVLPPLPFVSSQSLSPPTEITKITFLSLLLGFLLISISTTWFFTKRTGPAKLPNGGLQNGFVNEQPANGISGIPSAAPLSLHDVKELSRAGRIRVSRIFVHPIKSCRGTTLSDASFTPDGLKYDREWAIIDAETHKVVTARRANQMVLITPTISVDSQDDEGGNLTVSFPSDSGCESFMVPLRPNTQTLAGWELIDDIKLWGRDDIDGFICNGHSSTLSKFLEQPVHLVYKGPRPRHCAPTPSHPTLHLEAGEGVKTRYQDAYPLLIASEESLEAVGKMVKLKALDGDVGGLTNDWSNGKELMMERFRPNIVFKGAGVPWTEDVCKAITLSTNEGETDNARPEIDLVSRCPRCTLPNIDPSTGVQDKAAPLKVLMRFRTGKHIDGERPARPTVNGDGQDTGIKPLNPVQACFGMYAVPRGPGSVRVGMKVTVLR